MSYGCEAAFWWASVCNFITSSSSKYFHYGYQFVSINGYLQWLRGSRLQDIQLKSLNEWVFVMLLQFQTPTGLCSLCLLASNVLTGMSCEPPTYMWVVFERG